MSASTNIKKHLVDVNDSVLIVIDIQDSFLNKYDNAKTQQMVAKVAWLLHVADSLKVPVVAMAENIEKAGNLTQAIRDALPEETRIHDKDCFGLAEHDYKVVALKDALATTAADEELGLSRMRDAGATISSVKALYYEWLRSVSHCKALREATASSTPLKPPSCLVL